MDPKEVTKSKEEHSVGDPDDGQDMVLLRMASQPYTVAGSVAPGPDDVSFSEVEEVGGEEEHIGEDDNEGKAQGVKNDAEGNSGCENDPMDDQKQKTDEAVNQQSYGKLMETYWEDTFLTEDSNEDDDSSEAGSPKQLHPPNDSDATTKDPTKDKSSMARRPRDVFGKQPAKSNHDATEKTAVSSSVSDKPSHQTPTDFPDTKSSLTDDHSGRSLSVPGAFASIGPEGL